MKKIIILTIITIFMLPFMACSVNNVCDVEHSNNNNVYINTTLPNATVGLTYNESVATNSGMGLYYELAYYSNLPTGLGLSSDGMISGTPTISGTHTFDINAYGNTYYDGEYVSVTATVTIIINSNTGNTGYNIGDRGPANGFVFYDKGSYSDGWRYLEAAPPETEFSAEWGYGYYYYVGNTYSDVGTGKQNTQNIVSFLNIQGESGQAAQVCNNMIHNGFSGWFLPSMNELDLMYWNLHYNGLGGFDSVWYWSSTEYDSDDAYGQNFYDGGIGSYGKYYSDRVRAIRAF